MFGGTSVSLKYYFSCFIFIKHTFFRDFWGVIVLYFYKSSKFGGLLVVTIDVSNGVELPSVSSFSVWSSFTEVCVVVSEPSVLPVTCVTGGAPLKSRTHCNRNSLQMKPSPHLQLSSPMQLFTTVFVFKMCST